MTFHLREFDQKIAEVEQSISQALEGVLADDRLFVLRDLLLAQTRVCALHYKLMQLEKNDRLLLSDASFSIVMDKHLELAKFFRSLPKSGERPTYEMESIITHYRFIARHFAESCSQDKDK
jgi:hypothetical protein